MRDLMELEGIKFGGKFFNNIRFVDVTVLIADSEDKLQRPVQPSVKARGECKLKMDTSKTEVMVISKGDDDTRTHIKIKG